MLPSRNWRGSGDDLENVYHEFRVTKKRALSNQFGPPVPFRSVAHLAAAQRLEAAIGPIAGDTLLRGLQTTLPMGDLNATLRISIYYGSTAHAILPLWHLTGSSLLAGIFGRC